AVEHITIKFTTPPNPPVVEEIERYIQFQTGQPLVMSNVLDSFRKKYGQENSGFNGEPMWIYDTNGKLLSQVPAAATGCQPSGNLAAVITQSDLTHDAADGGVSLANTVDNDNTGLIPACVNYVYAKAWRLGTSPNDKVYQMLVSIRSGPLTYN